MHFITVAYTHRVAGAAAGALGWGLLLHSLTPVTRPAGLARLLVALAAAAFNVAAPLLLFGGRQGLVTRAISCFLLTWLCAFKALAWALGRGPLADPGWTPAQAVALYALPILPLQQRPDEKGSGIWALLARWAAKVVLLAASVYCLQQEPALALAREALYVSALYAMLGACGRGAVVLAFLAANLNYEVLYRGSFDAELLAGVIMDGPAAVAMGQLGLALAPHFPRTFWLSANPADFWGRRWNQAAASSLRMLVYEPIIDGSFLPPFPGPRKARAAAAGRQAGGGAARQAAAMWAAFATSGIMHEVQFLCIRGRLSPGLAWFWFFTLQAPLIILERAAVAALRRAGLEPPPALRTAVAACCIIGMAHLLFFGPAESQFVTRDVAAAVHAFFAGLLA